MPNSDASHIARLEERLRGVREDVADVMAEQLRHRKRLHDLEGLCATFVEQQKIARRGEERQYKRLEVRLQVLTVVVAVAAVAVPIVIALLQGNG